MTARRHRLWAVPALLALLGVTACSGLPGTGPVLPGRKVDENVAAPVHVVVPPPPKGASQEQIARDFIRAGAAFQESDDTQQAVGVAYLAPNSVDRWRPTASVTVFDAKTAPTVQPLPGDQIQVSTVAVATIDESGRYRELPPGTVVSAVFVMARVAGEWRVQLPDKGFGIWVSTDVFDQLFQPYRIHYVSPTERRLIPDVRWFPGGPRLATALARAQVKPVPDYLTGAVTTGIPQGTDLAVAVTVVDGVATVTLSSSAQAGEPQRRREMWAQFVATLTQSSTGLTGVSLEVQNLGKIPVPNLGTTLRSASDLGYASDVTFVPTQALLRTGNVLERRDPQQVDDPGPRGKATTTPSAAPSLPTLLKGHTDLALSADGTDLAALGGDLRELFRWRGSEPVAVPVFGTALTRPAYDSHGRLWVGGVSRTDGASTIWTFDTTIPQPTPPVPVAVPWLEGRQVVALAVSPDGTRVAVVSRLPNDQDFRLDVAGVARTADGRPASLSVPLRQGEPLTRYLDVVWLDGVTLAVLGKVADTDPVRPFIVDIGQGVGLRRRGSLDPAQTLVAPVAGARRITSTGGASGLVVVTAEPTVRTRVGSAWVTLGAATDLVVGGR